MPNIDGFKERWGQAYQLYRRTHHEEAPFNIVDLGITHLQSLAQAGAYATWKAISHEGLPPEEVQPPELDAPSPE